MNSIVDQLTNNLMTEVKDHLFTVAQLFVIEMVSKVNRCESPIEQIFAIYFLRGATETGFADNSFMLFEPQKEIDCGTKIYRVDFMISAQIGGKWVSLIVECDGHDYHERTKEQARNDKSRERALKAAGYDLIRFAGSEIWSDPYKCALETIEIMRSIAANNEGKRVVSNG